MSLRSPIYLDTENLLSQAEYHDIEVPRQAEIVEKTVRKQSGGGRINLPGVGGANADVGRDVETQSTYTLAPREKATVSKVIDSLIASEAVKVNPDKNTVLSKDDLVEIEGNMRITAASLAGKIFYIFRRLMDTAEGDLETMFDLSATDQAVVEQLKQVYLRNELLPIPILLEITGSALPIKVYVDVSPDHFIGSASVDRLEGEFRVLGTVSRQISGGDDGYLSAERWLLHDWEYLMRRMLMLKINDSIKDLVESLEVDLPAQDVHAHIAGPAIVVDAIALY